MFKTDWRANSARSSAAIDSERLGLYLYSLCSELFLPVKRSPSIGQLHIRRYTVRRVYVPGIVATADTTLMPLASKRAPKFTAIVALKAYFKAGSVE